MYTMGDNIISVLCREDVLFSEVQNVLDLQGNQLLGRLDADCVLLTYIVEIKLQ